MGDESLRAWRRLLCKMSKKEAQAGIPEPRMDKYPALVLARSANELFCSHKHLEELIAKLVSLSVAARSRLKHWESPLLPATARVDTWIVNVRAVHEFPRHISKHQITPSTFFREG